MRLMRDKECEGVYHHLKPHRFWQMGSAKGRRSVEGNALIHHPSGATTGGGGGASSSGSSRGSTPSSRKPRASPAPPKSSGAMQSEKIAAVALRTSGDSTFTSSTMSLTRTAHAV